MLEKKRRDLLHIEPVQSVVIVQYKHATRRNRRQLIDEGREEYGGTRGTVGIKPGERRVANRGQELPECGDQVANEARGVGVLRIKGQPGAGWFTLWQLAKPPGEQCRFTV